MCFVLMYLWILVFTLSLVSDFSPFSRKVFYVNFISPRIRISKYKVLSCGCCRSTVSCHRQLNLYPKFLHVSHRENGSFEVLFFRRLRGFCGRRTSLPLLGAFLHSLSLSLAVESHVGKPKDILVVWWQRLFCKQTPRAARCEGAGRGPCHGWKASVSAKWDGVKEPFSLVPFVIRDSQATC